MLTKIKQDDVLYEDNDILILNKPAGLATQTKKVGEKDLYSLAMNYVAEANRANNIKKAPYIAIINRLDQPVEGIVLMAKNSMMAGKLSESLRDDKIEKYYKATIFYNNKENNKLTDKGRLEDYIISNPSDNTSKICDSSEKQAKCAILEYEITGRDEKTAKCDIHLITGRHHQIRVQFANAGCPLVGDYKYGSEESIAYSTSINCKNVMLQAYRIEFVHPQTHQKINIRL